MAAFITRRRVEFRDTDAAGIVHFSAFFFWMESVCCDYAAAARFDEEIEIAVTVDEIGRSSVTYGFRFDRGGVTLARGRVVAVRCLMHPGRKPEAVPITPDIVARLEAHRPQA
jgi:4-hydroxybenzoyl-CoA thioesterase/acyl-CoA thioester hydrolase